MTQKNYSQEIFNLQNEIRSAITEMVSQCENKRINIPYYYDVDDYDEDLIDELINDGYNINEGNPYDNTQISLYNWFDIPIEDNIIACKINDNGRVDLIAPENVYSLTDIANLYQLADLHTTLKEIINKTNN